jgi:D-alanine-D-alanine ligase
VGTVAEEMEVFLKALRDGGFEVHLVNVEDDLERLLSAVKLYRPEAIFNLVEYFHDDQIQEAYIAGLYEMLGVQYTGNRAMTLANCQNKYRTKLILEGQGLPTAAFFLAMPGEPVPKAEEDYELDFPVIVKPAFEDASGGIEQASVVHTQEALEARCQYVFKEFKQPALVEEFIDGREIHAAVLGNEKPEVLPLFEMEFDDSEFNEDDDWRPQMITFRAKWDPQSKDFYTMDAVVPPEDLDEEVAEYIRDVARRAYKAMDCRDYARIDMRVDEDDEIYILEVNPNPDLVDGAAYAMCATASGRSYSESICAIADMAIVRARKKPEKTTTEQHGLPSDQLLREHLAKQKGLTSADAMGLQAEEHLPGKDTAFTAGIPEDGIYEDEEADAIVADGAPLTEAEAESPELGAAPEPEPSTASGVPVEVAAEASPVPDADPDSEPRLS